MMRFLGPRRRAIRYVTLTFIALAATCGAPTAADPPATTSFLRNGVTAHRGNSDEFPENTLPALQSGIEVGADWIELDIVRTKDGKLVVIHDQTTERVGDKNLRVADSTYEALQSVDVATDFRRRTGKTIQDCPVRKIPLLEDVLRLVKQQDRTRVSIQPKLDCVAEAVALVKSLGAERWVGFNDGNLQYMSKVKRLAPEIPVFWDRGADTNIDDDLHMAKQHGFESLVLHHSGVTSDKVRKIKAAGIEVGAWTVNDRPTMLTLLGMGVDRLYTDNPRLLHTVQSQRQFQPVECEGIYTHHLQGVCTDERDAIYWCFTTKLVKTDRSGKVLKQIDVGNHHGDLSFHAGQVFVAVNLGKFNDAQGNADSWVYVYNADDLSFAAKHKTPEVFHGAGGIAFHKGKFLVVGGLPEGVQENYAYEYAGDFQFVKKHVLASGHTHLGIQTAAFANDHWWFGCYGKPAILLTAAASLTKVERFEFDGSLGIVPVGDGKFLVARGTSSKEKGYAGRLVLAEADQERGLRLVDPQQTVK